MNATTHDLPADNGNRMTRHRAAAHRGGGRVVPTVRRVWPALLALACLLGLALPARADAVFPQHFQGSASKARKQHCYTRFTLHDDGHWSATTTFTNRRRLDSDRFEAVFRLRDEYGDVAVAIKHAALVRARYVPGRSNVVRVSSSGRIDPTRIPLHGVNVEYACGGRNFIPDHEIIGTLLRFIEHL